MRPAAPCLAAPPIGARGGRGPRFDGLPPPPTQLAVREPHPGSTSSILAAESGASPSGSKLAKYEGPPRRYARGHDGPLRPAARIDDVRRGRQLGAPQP